MALTKIRQEQGVVINEGSTDVDFRIESNGNANMLFVDGGTNKVGVGATPQCLFAIQDATTPELGFYRTSGATSGLLGRITMGNTDIDSGMGGLEFNQDGATNSSRIGLFTQPAGGASTERMRIDSSGKVLIGTTAVLSFASAAPIQVLSSGIAGAFKNTTAGSQTISVYNTGDSGTRYLMWFESNASKTHVGSISSNGSATAYNTSSDYRLKENVDYDWDATTRLKQLKPARFNFITDADTTVDGFIAHEAQTVVPNSVTGTKDEVDEDGVAVMQSIDNSKLVPLLVKTIQELEARLTAGGL